NEEKKEKNMGLALENARTQVVVLQKTLDEKTAKRKELSRTFSGFKIEAKTLRNIAEGQKEDLSVLKAKAAQKGQAAAQAKSSLTRAEAAIPVAEKALEKARSELSQAEEAGRKWKDVVAKAQDIIEVANEKLKRNEADYVQF